MTWYGPQPTLQGFVDAHNPTKLTEYWSDTWQSNKPDIEQNAGTPTTPTALTSSDPQSAAAINEARADFLAKQALLSKNKTTKTGGLGVASGPLQTSKKSLLGA